MAAIDITLLQLIDELVRVEVFAELFREGQIQLVRIFRSLFREPFPCTIIKHLDFVRPNTLFIVRVTKIESKEIILLDTRTSSSFGILIGNNIRITPRCFPEPDPFDDPPACVKVDKCTTICVGKVKVIEI